MPEIQDSFGFASASEFDVVLKAPAPWGIFKAYTLVANAVTIAIPGTSTAPILYNPPSSGVVFKILRVSWGVTGGTIAASASCYAIQDQPALSAVTAGPVPINANYFRGNAFLGYWYTAVTWATASTVIIPYGFHSGGANAAGPFSNPQWIENRLYINPGQVFAPCCATSAQAATVCPMVEFLQMPIGATQ
jgi:hypothetical protein